MPSFGRIIVAKDEDQALKMKAARDSKILIPIYLILSSCYKEGNQIIFISILEFQIL
jgi:hypothetical protein